MRLKEARKRWVSLLAPDGSTSERHSTLSRVRQSSVILIERGIDVFGFHPLVRLYDSVTGEGVGALDFLDKSPLQSKLTEDVIEKWWCLGDARNRVAVWVQGSSLFYS